MEKSGPQVWDKFWSGILSSKKEDMFLLAKEENSIRWQRIEKRVLKEFGSFENLKVIEIGAGAGVNAAIIAKRGAKLTLIDYSKGALKRSREFFENNQLSAEFLHQDVLSLPEDLLGKYDVSMSFGVAEHFKGTDRININKVHFDVLRKGGLAFISVPNKAHPLYRVLKYLSIKMGTWKYGEEYPYYRSEFRKICNEIGITEYSFFGGTLFWGATPAKIIRKLFKLKYCLDTGRIKKQKGTFLDQYLSQALVLCVKK